MQLRLLNAKIHHCRVTQCDPEYVGSITIDSDLLAAAGMRPNEAVLVLDVETGSRFETYVILGEAGSGIIGLNGPCSRLSGLGNRLIVITFGQFSPQEADDHKATVVIANKDNTVKQVRKLSSQLPGFVSTPPPALVSTPVSAPVSAPAPAATDQA